MKMALFAVAGVVAAVSFGCGRQDEPKKPEAHIVLTEHGNYQYPALWFDGSTSQDAQGNKVAEYKWFIYEPCFDPLMGTSTENAPAEGHLLVILPICNGTWRVDLTVTDINGVTSTTSAGINF